MLQRCRSEVDEYNIEHSMTTSKAGKNLFDREFRKSWWVCVDDAMLYQRMLCGLCMCGQKWDPDSAWIGPVMEIQR